MVGDHLLPGEGRRALKPSVEEARETNRSVRSLRAQFERGSVPPAPQRTKRTPRASKYREEELRAYLSQKKVEEARADPKEVSDLIARFQISRAPLAERDPQSFAAGPPSPDNTDTFGDLDSRHPKTDPGQLESYRRNNRLGAAVAAPPVPVSNAQSLHEMAAFAVHPSPVPRDPAIRRSVSAAGMDEMLPKEEIYPFSESVDDIVQTEVASDWGAADVHIHELFREAEHSAERAVQCDELEDYIQAFELYWVVVELYYKVMPFLSPDEAVDVNERVKMYTRRCEVIRKAFEDDPEDEGLTEAVVEQEEVQPVAAPDFNAKPPVLLVETPQPMQHVRQEPPRAPVPPPSPSPAKSRRQPTEGRSRPPLASSQSARPTQAASSSRQAEVHRPARSKHNEGVEPAGSTRSKSDVREASSQNERTPRKNRKPSTLETDVSLMRQRLPDYDVSNPGPAVPEAPRFGAASAAHRNSLSRPVSKRAVRQSTHSVSRERMLEMEERMQLMKNALHNFTVKRKHLGPARALELQITTLNANTFGDLKRLEPLSQSQEHKWTSELEVLLSMLTEIKESRPGAGFHLREDIAKHLPRLQNCDKEVQRTMRKFDILRGQVEYIDSETGGSAKGGRTRRKWWLKVPVVKRGGLGSGVRQVVEEAKRDMESVFKIAHEINLEVIKIMHVPQSFVDGLPRHARNLISKELKEGLTTWGMFKISDFMKDRNLYTREHAKDLTSSLEKVALIWESKTTSKSFLSRTLDIRGERGKNVLNAFRRCQNAIRDLRREFPTMSQTELDSAKIDNNEDIGLSGLEAYSRALESRAARLLNRIRELVEVDNEEKMGPGSRRIGASGGRSG